MRVEITLRNGSTVTADVAEFVTRTHRTTSELAGFRWAHDDAEGSRELQYVRVEQVDAVVVDHGAINQQITNARPGTP